MKHLYLWHQQHHSHILHRSYTFYTIYVTSLARDTVLRVNACIVIRRNNLYFITDLNVQNGCSPTLYAIWEAFSSSFKSFIKQYCSNCLANSCLIKGRWNAWIQCLVFLSIISDFRCLQIFSYFKQSYYNSSQTLRKYYNILWPFVICCMYVSDLNVLGEFPKHNICLLEYRI